MAKLKNAVPAQISEKCYTGPKVRNGEFSLICAGTGFFNSATIRTELLQLGIQREWAERRAVLESQLDPSRMASYRANQKERANTNY